MRDTTFCFSVRGKYLGSLVALMVCACDGQDPTAPYRLHMALETVGAAQRYGLAGQTLEEPVAVRLVHSGTRNPVPGVRLDWQTQGDAVIEPLNVFTDAAGMARARVRLGPTGKSVIHVSLEGLAAVSTSIEVNTTDLPRVKGISVQQAVAGEEIVLLGDFPGQSADEYEVLFDGVSARVVSATSGELRAQVPGCLGNRVTRIQPFFHGVPGTTVTLSVTEPDAPGRNLLPGEVLDLRNQAQFRCLRLHESGGYVLIAQNAGTLPQTDFDYTLLTFGKNAQAVTAARTAVGARATTDWEFQLRQREASSLAGGWRPLPRVSARPALVPAKGSRRTFQVFKRDLTGGTIVQARVRAVSTHTIIYEDLAAPAQLSDADFAQLTSLFDRVIQPTVSEVFGVVPDIDENRRVIILLTPEVNRLTVGDGSNGFEAGFASACDLVEGLQCTVHNGADMMYAAVPDSLGTFGVRVTRTRILEILPSLLAHELVHLIHFNQRLVLSGAGLEEVWLSEALAHVAEGVVADRLRGTGDDAGATRLRSDNYLRAARFLRAPAATSLLTGVTLAERGAGWLFLKYLTERFGTDVLARIVQDPTRGPENIASVTGAGWRDLFSDWSVALFVAALAPELPVAARYRFGTFDLAAALRSVAGPGPDPIMTTLQFNGELTGTLPPSSVVFTTLQATQPTNVVFAGARGGSFAGSLAPQVAVLRIR